MKQVFVLFTVILALIPIVYADDDWIDGIKIRVGDIQHVDNVSMTDKSEDNIFGTNKEFSHLKNTPLFPIAITLPETLMNSWSWRGALLEYKPKTELKDLPPTIDEDENPISGVMEGNAQLRQTLEKRNEIYNKYLDDSERSFADSNPNWALSGDIDSYHIFLGYYLGVFIPAYEIQRFFKIGAGAGILFKDVSLKLNICSQYKVTSSSSAEGTTSATYGGECVGKKEIESISIINITPSAAGHFTFWERVTKDSIWKIISIDIGMSRYEKLKNLHLYLETSTAEIVSYTYRF